MERVLVTGATGFIGHHVCARLRKAGYPVRAALRAAPAPEPEPAWVEHAVVGDIGPDTDWTSALDGVDAVVHLAARAHVLQDTATDPAQAFRHTNTLATLRLGETAAHAGVRRFVFMSSIGALAPASEDPLNEASTPRPEGHYGQSKRDAEMVLARTLRGSATSLAILRPPLVYGPGNPGNFMRLLRWVDRGIPLPLGSVRNRRSLLYVGNLADAVAAVLAAPRLPHPIYHVCDGEDISTPELIRRLAAAMGRTPRLFPCPSAVLEGIAGLVGRAGDVARLISSLPVDGSRITAELGWRPPFRLDEGLAATVRWYLGLPT